MAKLQETKSENSQSPKQEAPSNSVVKGLFDGFREATGHKKKNDAHEKALGNQIDPMTMENNRLIRRISNNTDTMIELLRKQIDGKKSDGLDFSKLFGMLAPLAGLAGLASLGALAPELAKAITTITKLGSIVEGLAKGGKTAVDLAKLAKETTSAVKGGAGVIKGAQTAKQILDASKNVNASANLTPEQKKEAEAKRNAQANGKWGNTLGVGMIAGRAYSGDYTGAGLETASTVLGNVSGKYAIPAKTAKALLDVGIVGRDVYRWKSGDSASDSENTGAKDWLKGAWDKVTGSDKPKEELKEEPKAEETIRNTNSNNSGGEFSNNVNSNITANSNNTINNYYGNGSNGGDTNTSLTNGAIPEPQTSKGSSIGLAGGLGATALGALALAKYKGVSLGGIAKGAKNLVSPTIAKVAPTTPKFTPVAKPAPKLASPKAITQGVSGTATKAGAKTGGMALAKGGAKMAGKAIPFLGLGLGAMGAYDRAKNGDYTGAGLEALSGVASFVPVVGTGAALAIQGGLMARDYKNASGDNENSISAGLSTGALVGGTALAIASRGKLKANGITGDTAKVATDATGVVADSAKVASGAVAKSTVTATKVMTNQANSLKSYMTKSYTQMTKASGEFFNNLSKNPQFIRNAGLVMAGVGGIALGSLGNRTASNPFANTTNPNLEISKQGTYSKLKQSNQYDGLMQDIYSKNGYNQRMQAVLKAQVSAESGFDINAKSHAGAFGLTQFMPATAKQYGVKSGDAKSQLEGQAKYMKYLLKKFDGNLEYALMGYNWGEGNVDKWLKSGKTKPIPKETRDYVTKIMGNVSQFNPDFGVSKDGKTVTGGKPAQGVSAPTSNASNGGTGAIPSAVLKEGDSVTSKDKLATSDLINIGKTKGVRIAKGVDVQNMNPKFMKLFYAMCGEYHQKTGKVVQVNSAYRSVAKQNELHNKNPKQATKGGSSMHNYGLAIDCNIADIKGLISANVLDKYGFYQSLIKMPNEQHHLEHRELTQAFKQKKGLSTTGGNENLSANGGDVGNVSSDGTESEDAGGTFAKLMTGLLNSDTMNAMVDYAKGGEIYKGDDRKAVTSVIKATGEGQNALKERETNLNGEEIDPNKFMTTKAYRLEPNATDYQSVIDKMATYQVRRLEPNATDYNSVKDKMIDHTIKRYGAGAGYEDIINKMTDNNTVTGDGANGKDKKKKWYERMFSGWKSSDWLGLMGNVANATMNVKNGNGLDLSQFGVSGDLSNNPLIMGGGFGGGITNNTTDNSVKGSNNVTYSDVIPPEIQAKFKEMEQQDIDPSFEAQKKIWDGVKFTATTRIKDPSEVIKQVKDAVPDAPIDPSFEAQKKIWDGVKFTATTKVKLPSEQTIKQVDPTAPTAWQDDPLLNVDISNMPPEQKAIYERARAMRDLNIEAHQKVQASKERIAGNTNPFSGITSVIPESGEMNAESNLNALANGDISAIQTKPTMMGGLMQAVQGYANGGASGALSSIINQTGIGSVLGEDMVGGLSDLITGNGGDKGSVIGGLVGALGTGFSQADKVIKANPRASKDGWGGFVNKSVGVLGKTLTGAEAIMDYKNNPEQAIMAGVNLGSEALSGIKGMFKKKPTDPTAKSVEAVPSNTSASVPTPANVSTGDIKPASVPTIAKAEQSTPKEVKPSKVVRPDGVIIRTSGDGSRIYTNPLTNEMLPLKAGEEPPDFSDQISPETREAAKRMMKENGQTDVKPSQAPIASISKEATQSLKPAEPNVSLKPDTFKDDVADKKVKLLNEADQASKNNVTANVTLPPTQNAQGKPVPQSSGGNSSGLSAPMVVRNPDSIIREVSVGMMKASM